MSTNSAMPTNNAEMLDDSALEGVSGGMSTLDKVAIGGAVVGAVAVGVFAAPAVAAEGVAVVASSASAAIAGAATTAGAAVASAGYEVGKGVEDGFDWMKSKL